MTLHFHKVRSRFTFWLLLISLTPLVVFSTMTYYQNVDTLKNEAKTNLMTIRDLKVEKVNNWIEGRQNDLSIIARDEEIIRVTQPDHHREKTEENFKTINTGRNLLKRYIYTSGIYLELYIVCAKTGKIIISTIQSEEGRDKLSDPIVSIPMQSKKPYISDIYESKILKRKTMAFSQPIFDPHTPDQLIGILVSRVDLEHSLYRLMEDRTGLGKTGETLIVNKDVVALSRLRWNSNAPLNYKIRAQPALESARGNTGILEVDDYRNEPVLAAFTHITKTGWGFVAKKDASEVYAPVYQLTLNLVWLFAISAFFILIVALILSLRLERPIRDLAEATSHVQSGDIDVRVSTDRLDEFGDLAIAFNEMTRAIEYRSNVTTKTATISQALVETETIDDFAMRLIKTLMQATGAEVGAFYRINGTQTFQAKTSIGADKERLKPFSVNDLEGEFGQTLTTGQISYISEIPEDSRFSYKAVLGDVLPKAIITLPAKVNGKIQGVFSLATFRHFAPESLDVLKQSSPAIDTAFENLLSGEETKRLADELQDKNQELGAINEELQLQSEELKDQTDELRETATELEQQRIQLMDADRLKSEFLSNMSHELRTPLNSVLALSQMMIAQGTGQKPEKEKEYLEVIERNGRHLLNLINDILDLSKIEAGRMEVIISPTTPIQAIERSLETIRPMLASKGLNLVIEADETPILYTDPEKLRQILLNLLSNAMKFTDIGSVTVAASEQDENLVFQISDTGRGIPQKDLPHIFDEFRQADGSLTREYEGTGLGLAICRKLTKLLGGELWVESIEGKGSTFFLKIPTHGEDSNGKSGYDWPAIRNRAFAASGSASTKTDNATAHNYRILIVEDNETAALQVQSALEDHGYETVHAKNGDEALKLMKGNPPHAIVLDLMMPVMDGFAVLDRLRATPKTVELPVLILTAKELTKEELARLSANNVQQLIQKGSVNREQLVAHVDALLEKYRPKAACALASGIVKKSGNGDGPILVVEDNEDNRLTISALLEMLKHETIHAQNGLEAIETVKNFRPRLILMDIQLPVMSGLEATAKIKADPELRSIPIVALTAKAMKGDREAILEAGCDDYLPKPIDPEKFKSTLNKWLG